MGQREEESSKMGELTMESLPLGFRFRPTDEELISHYLRLKINGRESEVRVIPEVDVCKFEPWHLPELSVIKTTDPEWFFFCPRDRKYPNGHRSNRATDAGYWKATGKDRTIKSRKTGSTSNSNANFLLIGMKKTLVFYRGRAPRGERTNWIMHEYRATEPDLDGTAPGQGAFVLCRLFRKPEVKADVSKNKDVEPTGMSASTSKSSADDMSSDAFQETAMINEQVWMQSEGTEKCLTDMSVDEVPNVLVPVESCNSYAAEQQADEAAATVCPQLVGDPLFEDALCDKFDWDVFSPLQLQIHTELGPYMGPPFANDFGNSCVGSHSGTSDQDVSFSGFLEGLKDQDNYSHDHFTSLKTSAVESETQMPEHISLLPHAVVEGSCSVSKTSLPHIDRDISQLQVQPYSGICQAQVSSYGPALATGNASSLRDGSFRPDAGSAESNPIFFYGSSDNPEGLDGWLNSIHNDGHLVAETGIRIRARQPREQPHPEDFSTQGTAPRRLRLLVEVPSTSICSGESGDVISSSSSNSNNINEEQKAQSNFNEAGEDTDNGTMYEESSKIDQDSIARPRWLRKENEKMGSDPVKSSMLAVPPAFYSSLSLVYVVSACVVAILFIVSVGMWKSPETMIITRGED